jgi:N-acyl-D-aspartate/D-glutamate deacylase
MYDVIIRNGTVVDGTGRPRFRGDIAIRDGVLVQVGGVVDGEAAEVIDADGLIVTPGFVDVHTHYDGQVTFDEVLEPSVSHGVTTVVTGSCGLGFAPARPDDHDRLIETMECVEDIPGAVLRAGLPWEWESFPEYLDFLEGREFSMDVATQVGHIAVRSFVMGERGIRNEDATSADIDAMGRIVREAIDAGALGFSTSRVMAHRTSDGSQVPGTFAAEDELFGIAAAMSGAGYCVFQLAQSGADGDQAEASLKELDWMRRLSAQLGVPVSFLLLQSQSAPDLWKELLDAAWAARADGAVVVAQVANRPFGMILGLTNRHPFAMRPTFVRVEEEVSRRGGSLADLVAELAKSDVRAAILAEADTVDRGDPGAGIGTLPTRLPQLTFPLLDDLDYEPTPEMSLQARAEAAGTSVEECCYDLMLEDGGNRTFVLPFFDYAHGNHDDIYGMLTHPASVPGLGDGGAHLATICDASMPTYQLTHWVTGRTRGPRLELEAAVKMQTHDTASLYGLGDRGTLEVGRKADLNVIDLDALRLVTPRVAHDLPASGARLLQEARGYRATIVSGVITRRDDADTGARPGRLVRGAR